MGGHLAISILRLKNELVDQLTSQAMQIQGKSFKFSKLEGEDLKEFYTAH